MANFEARLDPQARAILADALGCAIVGGSDTVRDGLEDFIRHTGADELMVTANIFDHDKRKRSFEIVAEAHGGMRPPHRSGAVSPNHRVRSEIPDPDQAGEASGLPFSTI